MSFRRKLARHHVRRGIQRERPFASIQGQLRVANKELWSSGVDPIQLNKTRRHVDDNEVSEAQHRLTASGIYASDSIVRGILELTDKPR